MLQILYFEASVKFDLLNVECAVILFVKTFKIPNFLSYFFSWGNYTTNQCWYLNWLNRKTGNSPEIRLTLKCLYISFNQIRSTKFLTSFVLALLLKHLLQIIHIEYIEEIPAIVTNAASAFLLAFSFFTRTCMDHSS